MSVGLTGFKLAANRSMNTQKYIRQIPAQNWGNLRALSRAVQLNFSRSLALPVSPPGLGFIYVAWLSFWHSLRS